MKPREFWIAKKETLIFTDGNLLHPTIQISMAVSKKFEGGIHVREVMPIDWERIWDSMAIIPPNKDAKEAFQEFVEQTLKGEL